MSHEPSPSPSASAPAMDHDANALAVVERFLGGEGAVDGEPRQRAPRAEDRRRRKVFDMTIEEIQHQIDAKKDRSPGSGSTGRGPVRG